jgi:trigger factor
MNVVRQDIDAVNAVLKVQIVKEDYQNNVKTALDKYRKNAKVPGFRPGHVPMGMIQKQYGKAVLVDELNKVVNKALYQFIEENKIEILGNPIPKAGVEVAGSFEQPDTFDFEYQIGLTPKFTVPISAKSKYDYVKVKVDAALVDKQIDDLRRRYGKLISVDAVGESDMILAQFVELKEDESILEGGIMHSSTFSMEFAENKEVKAALIGKGKGDKVTVRPADLSRGEKDTAALLGVKEEDLASISDKFQLTITEIKRMEMADINQELFDKLFGPGVISSEKEWKERITADLENMFATDSDRLLTRTIFTDLVENTAVELPNEFLKRWIKLSNEDKITDEQIEKDFDGYVKSLKWQLIQGSIFKTNEIKLENQEVIDFTKGLLVSNYAQYGIPAPEDAELSASAMQVLQNKEESTRIFDMLAEQKLTQFFKSTVKLNEKMLSYDAFVELAAN